MKKIFQLVMIFLTLSGLLSVNAQVRIGSDDEPHGGSILDLSNVNSLGLLLPRVSLSDVSVWSLAGSPADGTGMVVYNTNNAVIGGNGNGVYVWDGSAWKPVKPVVAVTGVSLDESTLTFTTASPRTLTATVAPSNANNKNVSWDSSNTSVATVSNDGIVTPVGNGSAIITVTTADGNKTASCNVTVAYAVTGVSLNESTLTFTTTTTQTLSATVAPDNADNKNVTWSSSNESIATVSENGVVTPAGNGSAQITVRTTDGNFTATCNVSVTFAITGITLSPASLNFTTTDAQTLTPTINPSNAANQTLDWISSNTSVATVSSSGVVTPVAGGTATITATATDGSDKSAACPVNVVLPYYFVQNGAYSGPTRSNLNGGSIGTSMAQLTGTYGFAVSGNLLLYDQDLSNATWENAIDACDEALGDGWRLPNIAELGNLQADRVSYGLTPLYYWSSTTLTGTRDAWHWLYNLGGAFSADKINTHTVRCVKSL